MCSGARLSLQSPSAPDGGVSRGCSLSLSQALTSCLETRESSGRRIEFIFPTQHASRGSAMLRVDTRSRIPLVDRPTLTEAQQESSNQSARQQQLHTMSSLVVFPCSVALNCLVHMIGGRFPCPCDIRCHLRSARETSSAEGDVRIYVGCKEPQ